MKQFSSRRIARRGRVFGLIATLVAVLGALGIAGPASAAPKGAFAVFADCPLTKAEGCIYSKTESGEFIIGKQTVPITNPIYLQSGFVENPANGELLLIGATDGKTLSKSPQNVPGGLLDLINCKEISNVIERIACELTFENKVTGVTATAELVGTSPIALNEGNLLEGVGTTFTMPVRLHLENPFLGSECYIGSPSSPILVPLTSGTTSPPAPNKPIKGSPGNLEFLENGELILIKGVSLVNNSFSVPGTNGCGGPLFSWLLDPIINGKLGIPASAGHNTAILNGKLEQAGVEAVKASE